MNLSREFLDHHGLRTDALAGLEATKDDVFINNIDMAKHPYYDRIRGSMTTVTSALVLGERGSGKTAMRRQMINDIEDHNQNCELNKRILLLQYDRFDNFLDAMLSRDAESFAERVKQCGKTLRANPRNRRLVSQVIEQLSGMVEFPTWALNDQVDAILVLAARRLSDAILGEGEGPGIGRLDPGGLKSRRPDLLVLATVYAPSDQPDRARRLRRKLGYSGLRRLEAAWQSALGWATTAAVLVLTGICLGNDLLGYLWIPLVLLLVAGWLPWFFKLRWAGEVAAYVTGEVRVLNHHKKDLHRLLMALCHRDVDESALGRLVSKLDSSRLEFLDKVLETCRDLGFAQVIVIVDQVDEPARVGADGNRMLRLIKSMIDLKLLQRDGIGVKLLLPDHLEVPLKKELDHDISRLDRLNLITSLLWSGDRLAELIDIRLRACAASPGKAPTWRNLLDDSIDKSEFLSYLEKLGTPRFAFKFMWNLFVAHSAAFRRDDPHWRFDRDTFKTAQANTDIEIRNFRQNFALS